jgi:hypothetical protein
VPFLLGARCCDRRSRSGSIGPRDACASDGRGSRSGRSGIGPGGTPSAPGRLSLVWSFIRPQNVDPARLEYLRSGPGRSRGDSPSGLGSLPVWSAFDSRTLRISPVPFRSSFVSGSMSVGRVDVGRRVVVISRPRAGQRQGGGTVVSLHPQGKRSVHRAGRGPRRPGAAGPGRRGTDPEPSGNSPSQPSTPRPVRHGAPKAIPTPSDRRRAGDMIPRGESGSLTGPRGIARPSGLAIVSASRVVGRREARHGSEADSGLLKTANSLASSRDRARPIVGRCDPATESSTWERE